MQHEKGEQLARRLRMYGRSIRVVTYTKNAVAVINGRLVYEVQREVRLAMAAWRLRRDTVLIEIPDWQTPFLMGLVVRSPKTYMKLHGPADFIRIINGKSKPRLSMLVDFREKFWARRVDLLESGSPVLVKHVRDKWRLGRSIPVTPDPIALVAPGAGGDPACVSALRFEYSVPSG